MIDCCELLIAEHRRTEDLLSLLEVLLRGLAIAGEVPNIVGQQEIEEVQASYDTLAQDLHRHYALEEKALFPVLSQYRTMMLMEVEHEDLLALQNAFAEQLDRLLTGRTDSPEALSLLLEKFEAFKTRLLAHILEEERGIFPLANELLEPEEKLKVMRLTNVLVESKSRTAYDLLRPTPGFSIKKANLSESTPRPMDYQTLFEREHTVVQTLRLHAGQQQAFHWAGQTQVMVVLQGEVRFEVLCPDGKKTNLLGMGDTLTIDSRLMFSLAAITEVLLIVLKVWPHPHYTKS